MAVAQHIVERVSALRVAQAHWEGVRQQASAQLLERAQRDAGAGDEPSYYVDNEEERLRSQISGAVYQVQVIGQELAHIRELLEADARESGAPDPERERLELVKRDDALKEQNLEAAAHEKEQRDKEFFAQKESDRVQALSADDEQKRQAFAKDEQDKEALAKADLDKQASQQSDLEFLAAINEEWEYVQAEIAAEWAYVDAEIQKEMEYNVEQTLHAVAEVGGEIRRAIANPISEKEAERFVDAQRQSLGNFVADEVFQAAPADYKEKWLKGKFDEQQRAEQETFGNRNDDGNRKIAQEGLAELQSAALDAVAKERKLEAELHAKLDVADKTKAETLARLEKSGLAGEALEAKKQQLSEIAKRYEQTERQEAEEKRKELWDPSETRDVGRGL